MEISTSIPKTLDSKARRRTDASFYQHEIDVAFLKDNVFRRNKRMIVFDMDSTLIQAEVIDELAELVVWVLKLKRSLTER